VSERREVVVGEGGRFGEFGGIFVPEILMTPVLELASA